MFFYFSMIAHFIHLKQQFKTQQYGRLEKKIFKVQIGRQLALKMRRLWMRYMSLNRQMSLLCKNISAYSEFYSKYLSILYLLNIVVGCYFAFAFFTYRTDNSLLKAFFVAHVVHFLFILLFVTGQCSAIVYRNCRTHRIVQKLVVRFMVNSQLDICQMLTIDGIAANYSSVKEISFKLLTNYRINSNMFQMLLYYTTMLLLMVFRQQ